jgi:hypothetical protein
MKMRVAANIRPYEYDLFGKEIALFHAYISLFDFTYPMAV